MLKHRLCILQYCIIPKSNDLKPLSLKPGVSFGIPFLLGFVRFTVNLDNYLFLEANKIGYEFADIFLSAEF